MQMPAWLLLLLAVGHASAQVAVTTVYEPPTVTNTTPTDNTSSALAQWGTILGNSLWFYEAQRSGQLPDDNRVSWRASSCLTDGQDAGVDLTRGYFDAGDYLLFTYPLSFTLTSIAWGAQTWGQGYDTTNQTAYLDKTLRWGLDWLMRAHAANRTLFVQVGDGNIDNNYWGPPENAPLPRPSYQVNDTSPGTDVVASTAAAFAAASILYSGGQAYGNSKGSSASLTNATYAAELLAHAESLWDFALNATGGMKKYSDTVPASQDLYSSPQSWYPDLAWAAGWLYKATNSSSYLTSAEQYYNSHGLAGQNTAYNWAGKIGGFYVLMAQMSVDGGISGDAFTNEATRYLSQAATATTKSSSIFLTSGGLLWYQYDSPSASLNPALNAALLALLWETYSADTSAKVTLSTFAAGQLQYALGKNPANTPYMVGINANSPQNPHSAMASGGTDINAIDTSPAVEAHTLYGALVGGPSQSDGFSDQRSDYDETEPALDYNAPIVSLAAWGVSQSMSGLAASVDAQYNSDGSPNSVLVPYYTTLQPGQRILTADNGSSASSGLSSGAKIAIAVIVVIVVLAIVGAALYFYWRRRR